MTASEYFASPGLSFSSLKDLAISPLRFWSRHIDPNRKPEEPSAEMIFGTVLHTAVLEPDQFDARYACKLDVADFPGALVTTEDLRGWLKGKQIVPKGTRKAEVIEQIHRDCLTCGFELPIIWDDFTDAYGEQTKGKVLFSKEDWFRIGGAAQALREEPEIQRIMEDGQAEVALSAADLDTGVLLKARLDWMALTCTLDIKTFSQKRGKSIDETVADAIYYERYHWQAYLYSYMRMLASGGLRTFLPHVIVFVESEAPHEVRIKKLSPGSSLYWSSARLAVRNLIRQYAECVERFGDRPWRESQAVDELQDEEIKALAYA